MKNRRPSPKASPAAVSEILRRKILATIDEGLAHTWLIRGDNRKLLGAVRKFFAAAPPGDLKRLDSYTRSPR